MRTISCDLKIAMEEFENFFNFNKYYGEKS